MFFKHNLSLFVLICFVSTNLASPSRIRREVSDGSSSSAVVESVKGLTNEIQKSLNQLSQNSEWIINNFLTIVRSSLNEGLENILSWAIDFTLRAEFLTMADGSHFMYPSLRKPETEKEYKAVAIAVSKLLMNLKTMKRTDEMLKNVTRKVLQKNVDVTEKDSKRSVEKFMRTLLHAYFESLDGEMQADEKLSGEYRKLLTEATEFVKRNPKMREALVKTWDSPVKTPGVEVLRNFFDDKRTMLRAGANKLFIKQSVKHFTMIFSVAEHKRYLLARALIQKAASSTSDSKINEIYHQALEQAAEEDLHSDDDADDKELETLFNAIEKGLESEPSLQAEIQVLMKEIESKTVYDSDMFHVDFSLL